MNQFWTNSIYYILLGIVSFIIIVYTLINSKRKKRDFGFFFAVFGLTLILETILYVFLKAYEYYPLIITASPKDDGVLGNLFSQISISAAAFYVCVLNIPFNGILMAGVIFYLVEKLFLALGIFQENWYRPWLTLVGIIMLFTFIKRWYRNAFNRYNSAARYFTVILGTLALYLPTTNWIGILSGYYEIKDILLIDPLISHVLVAIPKYLYQMNSVYFLRKYKAGLAWNALFVLSVFIIDALLYITHIMYVREGWLLIYSGLTVLTTYLYLYIMERLLFKH